MANKWHLSEQDKSLCIDLLTEHLSALRAKAGISQNELAHIVGISRQTYSYAESGHRRLTWETYLALLFFFDCNRDTHEMLHSLGAYPPLLKERFHGGANEHCSDFSELISVLDTQGRHTLRTVLLVEYARCTAQPLEQLLQQFSTLP